MVGLWTEIPEPLADVVPISMREVAMQQEPLSLDEFLSSRLFDVQGEKLKIYEALLAQMLRKYVPSNRKIEINLMKAYTDTTLDITLDENGIAKISWGEG